MSVTINKIAQLSGVSRGTVDRVLHGRGKVNPETQERVLLCAKELGYQPNRVGRALAVRKKGYHIAVVVCTGQNVFFEDVLFGIERMEKDFRQYGITVDIHRLHNIDPFEQLAVINAVKGKISGLIITPIDHPEVKSALNDLDVPIVNLNTDIEGTDRICYVGTDYHKGGAIAAGVVQLLKPFGATIGIVNGSKKLYGHRQREKGFVEELTDNDYRLFPAVYCEDDDVIAFEITTQLLEKNPQIDVVFVAAAGVHGCCRAIISKKREDITVICFDAIPATIEMMKRGLVKVTICQNPIQQGEQAMQIMLEFLVTGQKPETGNYILEHQLKIKQNY